MSIEGRRNHNAQFVDSMQGMVTLKALNASERRGRVLQNAALALYRATMAQLSISMIRNGAARGNFRRFHRI